MKNRNQRFRLAALLLLAFLACAQVQAQRVALKTNALYWATGTLNGALDLRLSRCITFGLEGAYNPVKFKHYSTNFLACTPEIRYWFSGRPYARHSVGLMAVATRHEIHVGRATHHGDALGGGVSYGYSFVLSDRLSLDVCAGVGVLALHEKRHNDWVQVADPDATDVPAGEYTPTVTAPGTEPEMVNNRKIWPVPMKFGVNLVYILK